MDNVRRDKLYDLYEDIREAASAGIKALDTTVEAADEADKQKRELILLLERLGLED